ncbi:MAG: TIGR01620 family protein [Phyllobacteriaceae bacterium]|nr:TIGR01620 family protein [Phyllobacteriaceae bacterium]
MSRKPMAFSLDPEPMVAAKPVGKAPARAPRSVAPAVVTPAEIDAFAAEIETLPPPALPAPRRRGVAGWLFGGLGVLLSLAFGLWLDQLIRDLFARADWLGWTAIAAAALALAAFLVILARELLALRRLASVAGMQKRAEMALAGAESTAAAALAGETARLFANRPETAAGRRLLDQQRGEIVDGGDLLRLAETEILGPLDAEAKTMVTAAARRVSVVTAVSPRAVVDVAYVLWEAARLVSRLSQHYGGRPGTLGFLRLARSVLAHLAVTGTIAAGDALVQQLVGQGLAARLSARLGEGFVNGMMTARIGIAAIETARPLPFAALKRPGLSEIIVTLSDLTKDKIGETPA